MSYKSWVKDSTRVFVKDGLFVSKSYEASIGKYLLQVSVEDSPSRVEGEWAFTFKSDLDAAWKRVIDFIFDKEYLLEKED